MKLKVSRKLLSSSISLNIHEGAVTYPALFAFMRGFASGDDLPQSKLPKCCLFWVEGMLLRSRVVFGILNLNEKTMFK